jgi:Coenzyme PQQ synthesis protein D (PqqD)
VNARRRSAQERDVLSRRIPGALLLVSGRHDEIDELSESAAVVWDALAGCPSFEELVDQVARRYGLEPAVIEKDIARILERLRSRGLVRSLEDD